MTEQLELFADEYCDRAHLVAYYRKALSEWPSEIMYYRHDTKSTGWSMALGRFIFAKLCFYRGVISRSQFKRLCMFNRKIRRWQSYRESIATTTP